MKMPSARNTGRRHGLQDFGERNGKSAMPGVPELRLEQDCLVIELARLEPTMRPHFIRCPSAPGFSSNSSIGLL
jgi:hypothetical protein